MRTFENSVDRDLGAALVDGVVEHHAVVRLGDAGRLLHRLRGEPDLAAHEPAPGGDVLVAPHALDRVRVLDRRVRVARGDPRDHAVRAVGLGQLVGDRRDLIG